MGDGALNDRPTELREYLREWVYGFLWQLWHLNIGWLLVEKFYDFIAHTVLIITLCK